MYVIFDDYFYRFEFVSVQKRSLYLMGGPEGRWDLINSSLGHPCPQGDIQAKWHSRYKNNSTSKV